MAKIIMFSPGELVKLGPHLWSDVWVCEKGNWKTFTNEWELENKLVLYVETYKKESKNGWPAYFHKIFFDGKFYFITDTSYAITNENSRSVQKVLT